MDERDELQQKIADIAGRYIQRTAGELAGLRDLIAKVRAGNTAAVKDIELLAHKIYGSGSMFGFEAVSEQARELELAAKDYGRSTDDREAPEVCRCVGGAGAGGLAQQREGCSDQSRAAPGRCDAAAGSLSSRTSPCRARLHDSWFLLGRERSRPDRQPAVRARRYARAFGAARDLSLHLHGFEATGDAAEAH